MTTSDATTFTLSTASVSSALYDAVRHRIIAGEIAPGEKVTEARLSEEYDVARPTARSSIERLAAAGLLARSAHRAAFVPILDEADISDIFLAREAVESSAVAVVARAGSVSPTVARAHAELAEAAARDGFPGQVAADLRFHRSLVADSGSQRLARMHDMIMGEVELTMGQHVAHSAARPEDLIAEHGAIIESINAGDASRAEQALRRHLSLARERLIAHSRGLAS